MNEVIYTDRSRSVEFQRCPRARWLGYEYGGRGLAPVRLRIPLTTGRSVHEGLAHLLQHPIDVDGAVRIAVAGYDEVVRSGDCDVAGGAHQGVAGEQRALIETLICAYAARQLGPLLDQNDVLEVEHEDLLPLGLARIGADKVPLAWMSRADALLQERSTGDLYLKSFKTAAGWDPRRDAEGNHDVQGLSEVAAVEARFAGWAAALEADADADVPAWFCRAWAANGRIAPRIVGVRMEYLLKGDRREDKWKSGLWVQYSPLIRGWRRTDVRPGCTGREYAWRYEWKQSDPLAGELRTRRLGRDWEPFNVWECNEVGGVKGWIEMLASGKVQPEAGDCLEEQFVLPLPYFRQQVETEDWFEQAAAQEARVAKMSAAVRAASVDERRSLLNRYFPHHRRSCDWPSACAFQAICFGSDEIARDPIASGLYTWREPHHQPERLQIDQTTKAA